uniref:ATP synthase F0 subunit 8 n=1 Tax=Austrarchaea harmsi TaxID=1028696 RepID=H2E3T9_9ARAC|nr:ATP synthase F0 subunit 8 [Austrarchaea harmsi]AEX88854.1 ATP synthase F0 subunit 8 [Austrarchaea harmsi]AEX88860.1 ATP synthase F0 subunit 8 [Austrarchaea harmsi]
MPQLSPLMWIVSSFMVMFLLMSMIMVFYVNSSSYVKVDSGEIYLMNWCW